MDLLHDVIEDHGDLYSFDDWSELGFPDSVEDALWLMTRDASIPYMDYSAAILKTPIARMVKIADLKHNLIAVVSMENDEATRTVHSDIKPSEIQ